MMRFLTILMLLSWSMLGWAQEDSIPKKKGFGRKIVNGVVGIIKEFNNVDTNYIEPQKYMFTTTLMGTYTYENYLIRSKSGQEVTFSPEARIKVGPYIGWSLLFLGYTVDIAYISANKKKEFDLSVYTSMFGLDFFRRESGQDYRIRTWDLGGTANNTEEGSSLKDFAGGLPYDGLKVTITGLNGYYVQNHHQFSYPAAFSQSTCQRRSAGSLLIGGGYTRHTLQLDYNKLKSTLKTALPDIEERIDSGLMFNKIKYTDVNLSAGYAYNWVFAKNWLFSVALSGTLAYKHSYGDRMGYLTILRDFSFSNFNFDGVYRAGVIWNDSKWYVGGYGVIHSYNYRKPQFQTNNNFGYVNVYIGFNFGKKKKFRKQHD